MLLLEAVMNCSPSPPRGLTKFLRALADCVHKRLQLIACFDVIEEECHRW
jgi:hypothetical protein